MVDEIKSWISSDDETSETTNETPNDTNTTQDDTNDTQASAPAAPSAIHAAAGDSKIKITWDPSTDADSYTLYRSTSSAIVASSSTQLQANIQNTDYLDASTSNDQPYYYLVTASNSFGTSAESSISSATPSAFQRINFDFEDQSIPEALRLTGDADWYNTSVVGTINNSGDRALRSGKIDDGQNSCLSLEAETTGGELSFNYKLSTEDGYDTLTLYQNDEPTDFNKSGESGWQAYTHSVAAGIYTFKWCYHRSDTGGHGDNAAWLDDIFLPQSFSLSSAPTALRTSAGDAWASVSWQHLPYALSYSVYLSTNSNLSATNYQDKKTISITEHTFSNLDNDQTYYFIVEAHNHVSTSPISATVSATPSIGTPSIPTNLSAELHDSSVLLSWDTSSYADTYSVYISSKNSPDRAFATELASLSATSLWINDLNNGDSYYLFVHAHNQLGESLPSEVIHAIPIATPSALSASSSADAIALSWQAVEHADGYTVYQQQNSAPTATSFDATYQIPSTQGTELTLSELTQDTHYYFTVAANTAAGVGATSNHASAIVGSTNTSPQAYATADLSQADEGGLVNLDGSASSDDGEIVQYTWQLLSPEVELEISGADQAQASFIAPEVEADTEFLFQLTVTDDLGATSTASLSITILDLPNPLPDDFRATAGDSQITLFWSAYSDTTVYNIYRSSAADCDITNHGQCADGYLFLDESSGLIDTGLNNATAYYYWIEAQINGRTYIDTTAISATPQAASDGGTDINEDDYQRVYTNTDGTIYALTKENMNWDDARAQAQQQGGDLVTIHSAAENQIVSDLLNGETAWLGASDDGDRIEGAFETTASSNEDGWRWVDGSELTYENWRDPAPNNSTSAGDGEEDCLTMYESGNDWNDLHCSERQRLAVFEFNPINLTDGLVAHYEFEGNADDSSGNANNAKEYGGMTYADGIIGKAASFDGIDDWLEPVDSTNYTNGFTHAFWAKLRADSSLSSRMYQTSGYDDRWQLRVVSWQLFLNVGEFTSGDVNREYLHHDFAEDEWSFVAFTFYPDGQVRLNLNGETSYVTFSDEEIAKFTSADRSLMFGYSHTDNYHYLIDGEIDDFRIYDRPLNSAEIQALYQLGQTNSTDINSAWQSHGGGDLNHKASDYAYASQSVDDFAILWQQTLGGSTIYPASGDTDGDGTNDLIALVDDKIYTINREGYSTQFGVQNSSSRYLLLADIDADSADEIFVGSSANGGSTITTAIYSETGILLKSLVRASGDDSSVQPVAYISGEDGLIVRYDSGYARDPRGVALWEIESEQETFYFDVGPATVTHSDGGLSLLDANADGLLEIAMNVFTPHNGASGDGFNGNGSSTSDGDLYTIIINEDGDELVSQKIGEDTSGGANGRAEHKFADIDNDGTYEIIATVAHEASYYTGDAQIRILALDGVELDRVSVGDNANQIGMIIADINDDAYSEIIIRDEAENTIEIYSHELELIKKISIGASSDDRIWTHSASDLDGDGTKEILVSVEDELHIYSGMDLQSLRQFTLSTHIMYAFATDLNGDDLAEIVASTNSGDLYLIGIPEGNGDTSNPPATPPAPTATTNSSSSITISWSSAADATSYKLYQSTDDDSSSATEIYAGDATSTTQDSLTPNTTYYYFLVACNTIGCSDFSQPASATTEEEEQTVPDTPSAPTLNVTSSTSIEVSWSTGTEASYYQLYRNTSNDSSSATKVYEGSATSTTQTKLIANTIYYYFLKNCNATGCSNFSQPASATTEEEMPNEIINLHFDNVESTSLKVDWSSGGGAGYYEVYRDNSYLAQTTSTYYNDSNNLNSNTTYTYKVKSCTSSGLCTSGVSGSVTTAEEMPNEITNLHFDNVESTSLKVDWSSGGGADYYEVYRDNSYLAQTTSTYYNDSNNLNSNTTYTYKVKSCTSSGLCTSGVSGSVTTLSDYSGFNIHTVWLGVADAAKFESETGEYESEIYFTISDYTSEVQTINATTGTGGSKLYSPNLDLTIGTTYTLRIYDEDVFFDDEIIDTCSFTVLTSDADDDKKTCDGAAMDVEIYYEKTR